MRKSICLTTVCSALASVSFGQQSAPPAASNTPPTDEAVKLSVFQVTSDQDRGYGSTNSIAGSRINMALKEVPNYTITLNEALLKDLGTIDMMDALPYASGVTPASTGFADTQFSLRGFALAGPGLRDGLPDTEAGPNTFPNDSTSYDRVEISKGPAGVLYGANSMGGIVNRVSKMPRFSQSIDTQLTAEAGGEDLFRGMVDATGPLGQDKTTAYRLAVDWQNGHRSWGGQDDRYTIYGIVRHLFGPQLKSSVWARYMFYDFRVNGSQGPGAFLDIWGQAPSYLNAESRNHSPYGHLREQNHTAARSYETGYETSFETPGAEWSLRILGRYGLASGDKDPSYSGGTIVALDAAGNLLGNSTTLHANDPRVADWRTTLSLRAFEGFNKRSLGNIDLAGKFDTGPANHTLILNTAGTFTEAERTFNFWNAKIPNAPAAAPNTFSLLNRGADLDSLTPEGIRAAGGVPTFNANSNNVVVFGWSAGAQDSIAFFKRKLIAVIGARYDWTLSLTRLLNQQLVRTSETSVANQDWTHKYGLVYAPIQGLSLFAQESTTYTPINSVNTVTGVKFPNQEGKSHEAGVKLEFFGGRLVSTSSVFDMKLNNVIIAVINPPELGGGTVNVPAGTQHTKGWETDLAYQPFAGLSTLVAFSSIDSTNEKGQGFRGVPQTATYSIFAKYSIQHDLLRGVGASVGYRHYGKKPVDATDTFRLAETDTVDAGLYYEPFKKHWSVQLNVLNVLDAAKPFTSVSASAVVLQLPRTYRLTTNYRF